MREITTHILNQANSNLKLSVLDEPGSGGANHSYLIKGFNVEGNPAASIYPKDTDSELNILFQNGPILEVGVNGVTQEVLLAILIDRLQGFQKGPYSTKANACALTHLEEAMHWLHARTLERMQRGVEGTLQK